MNAIDSLTLGEIAKVEELSGQSVNGLADDNAPKGKMLAAMAFVVKRRSDREFTWNDAMGLTMEQANAIIAPEDDADATDEPEDGDEPDPTEPKTPARRRKSV